MIESHDSTAIDKHEGRGGAGTETLEIRGIERHLNAGNVCVEAVVNFLDERVLVCGGGVLIRSGVAVAAGRRDHKQAFGAEFGTQAFDNRSLCFAVGTPVCPEEQQYHLAA